MNFSVWEVELSGPDGRPLGSAKPRKLIFQEALRLCLKCPRQRNYAEALCHDRRNPRLRCQAGVEATLTPVKTDLTERLQTARHKHSLRLLCR
ncbi:hypothetical protein J0S82_006174 [Galemys pyrenaicus]|uniref:Uncharacterized protein n=1 Tax=Galemys pyrenaicus TaxID=202257 RepID=A0A8J5ZS10_GALPY|nr:hypothetical protein J0S82_006174 [Galemys pyrenaicus]